MRLKPGVQLGFVPAMIAMQHVVSSVYREMGIECVITSGRDGVGVHREGSLHFSDRALDYRTRDVPSPIRATLAKKIADRLGAEYDVVLEKDHLHVEWDPK